LWLGLGLALAALNLALSFHNLWPTPWVTTRYELSVEIAALVLLLALLGELGRLPSRRLVKWLAVVLVIFAIGRYMEVTAPALYGRRINLYWDAQHLPRVAAMLFDALPAWQVWLLGGGIVGLVAFVFVLIRALLSLLADRLAHPAPRRFAIALGGALVALYAAGHLHPQVRTLQWFSLPVSATYAQQAGFLYRAVAGDPTLDIDARPLPDSSLARLAGADVLLLFFESYGAATLEREEFARALADPRRDLAAAVERTGRQVMSARVRSPTFGGASWLAHSSFLAGIEVTDNRRYQQLLTTRRDTLVQRFEREGYRTVGLMPGLRRAWPEGAFYGYDRVYDAASLDYAGPAFGWWRIPDQYALARLDALESAAQRPEPVLAVMNSITSHVPFHPVPPYRSDWQALLGPRAYAMPGGEGEAQGRSGGTDMADDYVAAVEYVLTCVAGYLRHRARDELVLIVIGDHQPPALVSGPEASWDVPVHVIARDPSLMAALRAEGFVAGLEPAPTGIAAMHDLAALLLRAFDGDAPPTAAGAAADPLTASRRGAPEPRVDVAGSVGR
jgi:hypothetical protein